MKNLLSAKRAMKISKWIIIKRLPGAIKIYFLVRKMMMPTGDKKLVRKVACGYFKLSLAWS